MRANCWQGKQRMSVEHVPDPKILNSRDAVVKITLTTTNDVRTAPTDNAGTYTIPSVTPGAYTVEILKEGFRSFIARNIQVNQNNVVRVDASLQVGATAEKVEVIATASENSTSPEKLTPACSAALRISLR